MQLKSLKIEEQMMRNAGRVEALYSFRGIDHEGDIGTPVVLSRYRQGQLEFFVAQALVTNDVSDFHPARDCVSVVVDHEAKRVRFGPNGNIVMQRPGTGLGSALISLCIEAIQEGDSNSYVVVPGSLSDGDAETQEERHRRNRFYLSHGFNLLGSGEETDPMDIEGGSFSAPSVSVLIPKLRDGTQLTRWRKEYREMNQDLVYLRSQAESFKDVRKWFLRSPWWLRALMRRFGLWL